MISDKLKNKGFAGVLLIDGVVDGTQLAVSREPTKMQKFFFRKLFGWGWMSIKDLTKTKKK